MSPLLVSLSTAGVSMSQPPVSSGFSNVDSCSNCLLECSQDNATSCPMGLFCLNEHCRCGLDYPDNIVNCNGTVSSILTCNCATVLEEKNLTVVGACLFISGPGVYNTLTRDYSICERWNRAGALCGRCLPDHYPLAYSFNLTCIRCPHARWNWVRYIMAAYLPLTLFYIIVLFFSVSITNSQYFSVVMYAQFLTMPAFYRIIYTYTTYCDHHTFILITNTLASLYGVWNLDFFRPFYSDICLGIGLLPTLALDYVIAVYPLFLMIVSYLLIVLYDKNYRVINVMWRPFKILFSLFRKKWDIRTSVIDAFATFFLLSNIKFFSVSFDLLVPIPVYELHHDHYNYTWGLYYSGDIEYFGPEHLPYGILDILVSMVCVVFPIVILVPALPEPFFFQKTQTY